MSYDLKPNNDNLKSFHFGAFSFPVLIEAAGYLFSCIRGNGQWYCVFGLDSRMPLGDTYPSLLSNDGFPVTAEEAKILARIARNFVAVQQTLGEEQRGSLTPITQMTFKKEDLEALFLRAFTGGSSAPWPLKIHDDFVEQFAAFAEWADESNGFEIW